MQSKIFSRAPFLKRMTDASFPSSSSHEITLIDSISLKFVPKEIDVSPDGNMLFVAHEDGSHVSFVDISERKVFSSIKGRGVGDITVSPDGLKLYVAEENECSVIDVQQGSVIRVIDSEGVDNIAASADGRFICMSFRRAPGGLVRMVDAEEYRGEVNFDLGRMSDAVQVMAISPDGNYIYASELSDEVDCAVAVIDTRDYSQVDIPGVRSPCSVAVSTNGRLLYVGGFDEVFVIDTVTHKVLYILELGSRGYPVNIIGSTPNDKYVYAIHTCHFDLYKIDTLDRSVTCVDFFHSVGGAVISPDGTRLYATHPDRKWVSIYAL